MYDWDWDKIAEYYQQRQERDSHQSECWAGMLMVGSQLRSDPDLLEFGKTIFKDSLVIGLKDLSYKLPPGFPTGIGVHWIARNEFQISIFIHETVRVPQDKAIPAIKLYLSRVKRLVNEVRLTDEDFEILSAAYRNRTKEDLKLLYSKLPLEWLAVVTPMDWT